MLRTRLCDLLGIEVPIILAPMQHARPRLPRPEGVSAEPGCARAAPADLVMRVPVLDPGIATRIRRQRR